MQSTTSEWFSVRTIDRPGRWRGGRPVLRSAFGNRRCVVERASTGRTSMWPTPILAGSRIGLGGALWLSGEFWQLLLCGLERRPLVIVLVNLHSRDADRKITKFVF